MQGLETQWKELNALLDEKLRLGKARTEQQVAYERLRDQVQVWLANIEGRIGRLEPVAIDIDVIKRQADELKVIFHIVFYINIFILSNMAKPLAYCLCCYSVSRICKNSV